MNRKYVKISISIFGILLIIFLVLTIGLPRLFNSESIQERVLREISGKVGGEVSYEKIELSFFLSPHLVIHNGTFSIEDRYKYSGSFQSMSIYPEILPLLKGKIRIYEVEFQSPDITITIPENIEKQFEEKRQEISFLSYFEIHFMDLVSLASKASGISLRLEDGTFHLSDKDKSIFWLRGIHAYYEFHANKIRTEISFESDLSKNARIKVSIDSKDLKSGGEIEIFGFKPEVLANYLNPESKYRLTKSDLSLKIIFQTDGPRDLMGKINGTISSVTLLKGKNSFTIKGGNLNGDFHINEQGNLFSLTELDLDTPKLNLSGEFLNDRIANQISLNIKGRKVGVPTTREAAMTILGENRLIQKIFEIIKSGNIPEIEFNSQANSLSELTKDENFTIRGKMQDGEIFVPVAEFNLKDVSGDVVISDGLLEGSNLVGRLEDSRGNEGKLKLGFKGRDAPFKLDIKIDADLSQLPPILKRFVKNDNLLKELSSLSNVTGSGVGRLVLGDTKSSIKTFVEVSQFNLSGEYHRLPYPLSIKGNYFLYDKTRIEVKNLSGNLATSNFSELSGAVGWENKPFLIIESSKSNIALEEVYPWLSSLEPVGHYLRQFRKPDGVMRISSLTLNGPLANPGNWDFEVKGEGELNEHIGPNISLDLTKKPNELRINSLKIVDQDSSASLIVNNKNNLWDLDFLGNLTETTLDKILENNEIVEGWIRGEIKTNFTTGPMIISNANGTFDGEKVRLTFIDREPFQIDSVSLQANGNNIDVDSLMVSLGNGQIEVKGNAKFASSGLDLDIKGSSDFIEWDEIKQVIHKNSDETGKDISQKSFDLPIKGNFRLDIEKFKFNGFTWNPFNSIIELQENAIEIDITDANICDIFTPGTIKISDQDVALIFNPTTKNQELEKTLKCLGNSKDLITGIFDIDGEINVNNERKSLLHNLNGILKFNSERGIIHHKFGIFAKVISYISISDLYRGQFSSITKEGLKYNSIKAEGAIKNGILTIKDATIDSSVMGIVIDGDINLINKTVDLKLLVAPLKTVDTVIKKIPLIKRIRGGNLLSIPVKVKGDFSNPEIKFL